MNSTETVIIMQILLIFAVYRLSRLLAWETGFMGIFERIRSLAGVYETEETRHNGITDVPYTVSKANNPIGEILTCFYCTSVWVAMPAAAIAVYYAPLAPIPIWLDFVIQWLGIAGAVAIIKDVA